MNKKEVSVVNRTQRAIKKHLREIQNSKKAEKRRAIYEMIDDYGFTGGSSEELKELVRDEKSLKKWHHKIVAEGQKPAKFNAEEVLTAF